MSDHSTALIPVATGYFQSPELFVKNQVTDIGLFAESLVYYDNVYIHVDNPEQFAGFISEIIKNGFTYERLVESVENGTVRFYNSVLMMPFMGFGVNNMVSSFWAMSQEGMDKPDYFSKKFLSFEGLKDSFSTLSGFDEKVFSKFCKASEKTAVTYDGKSIADGLVNNAYEDFLNPKRNEVIVKNLLKEVFKANRLGKPPKVKVKIQEVGDNYFEVAKNKHSYVIGRNFDDEKYKMYEVEYNRDLIKSLKNLDGTRTAMTNGISTLPLSNAGHSNLIIRSANKLNCDLFLPNPISKIIGDKLYEIGETQSPNRQAKIAEIINKLEAKVEFPDLRRFVNSGKIDFDKIFEIREKAKPFRKWLQSESERDRDAIIAYHNEIAKKTGFNKIAGSVLKIFGLLASVGFSIGAESFFNEQDVLVKESAKKAGGKAIENLTDKVSKKFFGEWKPVCFGDWYKEEIETILNDEHNH